MTQAALLKPSTQTLRTRRARHLESCSLFCLRKRRSACRARTKRAGDERMTHDDVEVLYCQHMVYSVYTTAGQGPLYG